MKIAARLLLSSLVVIVVLTLTVAGILDRRLHERIGREELNGLTREARLVAAEWVAGENADTLAHHLGSALGDRVTLIGRDGVVVGDSQFDSAGVARLENHAHRPEVAAALAGRVGSSRRVSPSRGDQEVYVAVPAPIGVARVSETTVAADAIAKAAVRDVLIAGTIAMVVALGLAWLFARGMSRPVAELRDVARAIAAGDLTRRPAMVAPGELGELADAVRAMADQLESRLSSTRRLELVRRDFVANVSHELRTPLTVIGGFAETLAEGAVPEGDRARFAQLIATNTQRMQRIVDELLDLSRIESGGWIPRPVTVDVAEVAADVTAASAAAAEQHHSALDAQIAPDARTVYADRTALRQILANLVENAVRHTTHGSIIVFARREADGWITVGVRDTGSGIPAEHLPRIFERFYRADAARSRESGGTGLGLSIVKHLVEAHGGRVDAESTVGHGTTIMTSFPPAPPRRPDVAGTDAAARREEAVMRLPRNRDARS